MSLNRFSFLLFSLILAISACSSECEVRVFSAEELSGFINDRDISAVGFLDGLDISQWEAVYNGALNSSNMLNVAAIYESNVSVKAHFNKSGDCDLNQLVSSFDNILNTKGRIAVITSLHNNKAAYKKQIEEFNRMDAVKVRISFFDVSEPAKMIIQEEGFFNLDQYANLEMGDVKRYDGSMTTIIAFSYKGYNVINDRGSYNLNYGFILLSKRNELPLLPSFREQIEKSEKKQLNFPSIAKALLQCQDEDCIGNILRHGDFLQTDVYVDKQQNAQLRYRTYDHIVNAEGLPVNMKFSIYLHSDGTTRVVLVLPQRDSAGIFELDLLKKGYSASGIQFDVENAEVSDTYSHSDPDFPTIKMKRDKNGTYYEFI